MVTRLPPPPPPGPCHSKLKPLQRRTSQAQPLHRPKGIKDVVDICQVLLEPNGQPLKITPALVLATQSLQLDCMRQLLEVWATGLRWRGCARRCSLEGLGGRCGPAGHHTRTSAVNPSHCLARASSMACICALQSSSVHQERSRTAQQQLLRKPQRNRRQRGRAGWALPQTKLPNYASGSAVCGPCSSPDASGGNLVLGGVPCAVRALCEKLAVLHHREFGKFRRLKGRH